MRPLLVQLLIACLCVTSVAAESSQTKSPVTGVWVGSIGKLPITACFNDDGEHSVRSGSYYYHRHLVPIELGSQEENAANTNTTWNEANGAWQIDSASPDQLSGTWSTLDKSRKLPIKLARVPLSADDSRDGMSPCGSHAYNKAIEATLKTSFGPTMFTGRVKYRVLTVAFPEGASKDYKGRGLYLETIEIVGDSPSIVAINKSLRRLIDPEGILVCRFTAMNLRSMEGTVTQEVSVSTPGHLISVSTRRVSFCGDRSHQLSDSIYMWNLNTGKQESLFSWFKGVKTGSEDDTEQPLPDALDRFIATRFGQGDPSIHLSRADLEECYGQYRPGAYSYQLQLLSDGINFTIPPTGNGSCGDSFKLTFKELKPFLNKTGQQLADEIQAAQKANR